MIKQSMIFFLLATVLYLFIGCATPNITIDRNLNDNEGILITKIHANEKLGIIVYESKGAIHSTKAETGICQSLEELKVIPVESGKDYYLGLWNAHLCKLNLKERLFGIEAGSITYIGDLYVNWGEFSFWTGCSYAQTKILDKEDETIGEAREKYPWLFEKYPYKKKIPVIDIETVEGFEKVEELKRSKDQKPQDK